MWRGVDYWELGERARRRRHELRLTQEQLAERVGVSISFIGHIERAEKTPSVDTLVRLSLCLDMSLDELILGRINRCDQQKCPLYEAVEDVMNAFGPANFKT